MFQNILEKHKKTAKKLKTEPITRRKQRLESIKTWIYANQQLIQEGLYKDLQKSPQEADISEIYPILTELRHAIKNLRRWSRPKRVRSSPTYTGTAAYIHYEPLGTCLIISPWNYPFNLAMGPLISAIAAGNTVILKPSEFTPNINRVIHKMVEELFSEDMIFLGEGGADVSQELLKLPFDHIFFTGSPAVGKLVMEAAAKNLSSVTLELGGKSPTVVDETADLKDAAEKIAWGKWINAGQTCVAPDYLFLHKSVSSQFLQELKVQAETLYKDVNQYTSIINERHFERLKASIENAVESGGEVVFAGAPDPETRKIPPVVITNVSSSSILLQEEIFGPVLPVLEYDELQEVIDYINTRPKPLALYYFSKSKKNQRRILQETSSGTAVVNDAVLQFAHPNLPFGGVNNSGIGKSHGKAGFLAFTHEKSVLKQRIGWTMAKTVYPPYTGLKNKMINFMLKYF